MRKLFFFIIIFTSFAAYGQNVLHINAGSRASWGKYQSLIIDANGKVTYHYKEVNGKGIDSSIFSITRAQLDSFFIKADQVGFFLLKANYDGGKTDGAGITISMNSSGRLKRVSLRNIDVPQVNELVSWLNRQLQPRRIRIYYGQK